MLRVEENEHFMKYQVDAKQANNPLMIHLSQSVRLN